MPVANTIHYHKKLHPRLISVLLAESLNNNDVKITTSSISLFILHELIECSI